MLRLALIASLCLLALTAPSLADDSGALHDRLVKNDGVLHLEGRTYHFTNPLTIHLDKIGPISITGVGTTRIVMEGSGPAIHLIGTHDGTADPDSVDPEVWEKERGPVISGIEIVGGHPKADGILAEGTMQMRIEGVAIRKARHAIHLVKRNRNVIISNCNIYENEGIGIYFDHVNLHQTNIVGCHISYNGGGGIVTRGGAVRNIQVTGCDIEGNMAADGPPTANILLDSRQSSHGTAEVAITGCTIQHTPQAPHSANIRIFGSTKPIGELKHPHVGHITITGNVLSLADINIHLDGCRGVTIVGNTAWQGSEYTLLAEHCQALIIGPNNFERSPYYHRGEEHYSTDNAVKLVDCREGTITGLHVTDVVDAPAGVLLKNCRRMAITGCTIFDCDGPELMLQDCENCIVTVCLLGDQREDADEEPLVVQGGKGVKVIR